MTIRVPLPGESELLTKALDGDMLDSQAGWLIFERGREYAAGERVTGLEATATRATATAVGTRPYEVSIELEGAALNFDCSCPMGRAEEFCKHLVAVGLVVLGDDGSEDAVGVEQVDDLGSVRAWLEEQPVERLRHLLFEQADRDPELHRLLSVYAAAEMGGPIDLAPYRAAVAEALAIGVFDDYGYVQYRDAWAWRQGVDAVLDDLEGLLAAGFGAETVDLAEDVLGELNDSVGSVDDSDGHLYELFERAMDLHLAACSSARPDPVALAGRLFDWACRWELDSFLNAVDAYAHVLGEEGLAAYRRLAEEEWQAVPVVAPGDDARAGRSERFRIRTIMESLAETTGGLEELLEVMQRDLGSGYAFLRIAEACRRYRRDDLALDWAQRGRERFPGDRRLAELICDAHADAGRHDEALAVARDLFGRDPTLERYQRLRTLAEAADAWPAEREPALASMRARIAKSQQDGAPRYSRRDGSVLVEVLLWEDDTDAAWEAGQTYGCNDGLSLHLAAARGEEHPADALELYRRHLDAALQPVNNNAYDQVVRILQRMRPLSVAVDRNDEFEALIAEIRATYKRRRNLMGRLDGARL